MKKAVLISVLIIASLLIVSLAFSLNTNNNSTTNSTRNDYSNCIKTCNIVQRTNHSACVENYKNDSSLCKADFRTCFENINATNKKDIMKNMRMCSANNTICLKNYQAERKICEKNAVEEMKICKDKCQAIKPCPTSNSPICGKDNITYSNECQLKKANATKDCKGQCPCLTIMNQCVQEGGSIPVILNAPKCCSGLKLIKPMQQDIAGTSGICTAKCGNGICDNATETNYNCPKDCFGAVKNYCKASDRRNDTVCPAVFMPVCAWFDSSKVNCTKYPCAIEIDNACNACRDYGVSYWTNENCPAGVNNRIIEIQNKTNISF